MATTATKTHCRRGHDLAVHGRPEVKQRANGEWIGVRCRACQRETLAARKVESPTLKATATVCRNGHDLMLPAAWYRSVQNGKRQCMQCRIANRKAASLRRATKVDESTRADRLLELVEERDRAMTPWGREELTKRINAMMRKMP